MAITLHIRTVFFLLPVVVRFATATQILPLLQYDMTNEDCYRSTFLNGGILGRDSMTLIRNSNTTACTPGFGLESKSDRIIENSGRTKPSNALFASKQMGSFLEKLSGNDLPFVTGNGLTISLWIRPNFTRKFVCSHADNCNEPSSTRSIFAVGWDKFRAKTSSIARITPCDEAKIDFQVSIGETNTFEIIYRTNDQVFEPCQRMVANLSTVISTVDEAPLSARPMHVAISLGNYHQEVFINGISLARKREPFDAKLKHWNSESLLQFFKYPTAQYQQSAPWDGQLFQFAIYGRLLNKQLVRSVMSEGLSPSQPVAYPNVVNINEDALDKNGTLQHIEMPYTFLDDEIESLISSLDLPHQPIPVVRHYITRFPTRGYLLHIEDHRMIEPSGNLPILVSNADRLIFMPIKDEHSEFYGQIYSSFDYCVTTNKIILSSQCAATTISVIVDPVNDPPVAIAPPLYFVHEGIQNEASALRLTGSDVDKNDFIQNIQITSTPKMGFLFLSVSSFRKEDNLLHGTDLRTRKNFTIPGKEVYIEYRFTDYNTSIVQGSLVMDFFRFRVQDRLGSWSSEAEVKIQVLSSVFPSSNDSNKRTLPSIDKGGGSYLLSGVDSSGLNRNLGFLVTSLPSIVTVLDRDDSPLLQNEIIPSSSSSFDGTQNLAWTNVTYVNIPNVCDERDSPFIRDIFRYQVVALDSEDEVTSVSSVKEEEIVITCEIQPVSLSVINPDGSTSISVFLSPADDNCSGYVFDFSEESTKSCRNTTRVFGVQLENTQKLLEPVYVVITSSFDGMLSINQNNLINIPTLIDQPVMRRSIRFISPVDKLADALSEIHFQSDSPGTFEIQVTLQYGRCENNEIFLVENKFSQPAFDCYKTQEKIYLDVQRNPKEFILSHYPFPWLPLLVIVLLGPILYIKGKSRQAIEDLHAEWKEEGTIELVSG